MLTLKPRKPAVCRRGPSTLELLIGIDPDALPPRQSKERPGLNLALVLDRSDSMQGEAFELTLEAACRAVQSLRDSDTLVIVLFDDVIETLYAGKATDRDEICKAVRSVQVGNTTNLFGGWHRGAELLGSLGEPHCLSRVVLLTDGHANEGVVAPTEICHGIEQWQARGVQTTTLGFGPGYDEDLLRRAATAGQGNHAYIEDAKRLSQFFEEEMKSLLRARGSEVRLSMNLGEGVSSRWLGDLSQDEGRILLANLVPGEPLAVLAALELQDQPPEKLACVHLSWFDLDTRETISLEQNLTLPAVDAEEWEAMKTDSEVDAQLARCDAERRRQVAMHLLKQSLQALALQVLDDAVELPHLPREDRRVLFDLISTVESGDYEASYKKAAMYSHGHGSGHARSNPVYYRPEEGVRDPRQRASLPIHFGPSLLAPLQLPRAEWPRIAGMLRGHFYGERLARGNRVELSEGPRLSMATLNLLLGTNTPSPSGLAHQIFRTDVTHPTTSLQRFRRRFQEKASFMELGSSSAGCAALRRVCPFLVSDKPFPQLDAALATLITHNDSLALTSSVGYTVLLWHLLRCPGIPEPGFYLRTFLKAIEGLEKGGSYTCRGPAFAGWTGRLHEFLPMAFELARDKSLTLAQAKKAWGSGPYLLEVVPTALYALELHADDPWKAMDEVVENSMEADTLGMLVGACVGAIHGPHKGWFLPEEVEQRIDLLRTSGNFA